MEKIKLQNRRYFGTDGIRGKVGSFPITAEFALRLGYAAGRVFASQNITEPSSSIQFTHKLLDKSLCEIYESRQSPKTTILIGKDTRISGYMLEPALVAGFTSAGVDVLLAGPMPTPAIAYLTRTLRLSAGVVISASHNAYIDNGIKFFSANGSKFADILEAKIEAGLDQPMVCASSDSLGKVKRIEDSAGRYIEFCKSTFPANFDLRGLRLVVDCAHGAAYHIAPHVFHELGADVIPIGVSPNGFNINDGVGATSLKSLVTSVIEHKADIGVALDGDADRLQIVDNSGRIFNGDELLYVFVTDAINRGRNIEGVVGTLMTNIGVERAINELGIKLVRAEVGDRYIFEKLCEHQWTLGAEASGHIIDLEHHTTGDGIISALQVLAALRRSNLSLSEILKPVQVFPQSLVNVKIATVKQWKNSLIIQNVLNSTRHALSNRGRVLIRESGTEPVLRVMVEADEQELASYYAQLIAFVIQREIG